MEDENKKTADALKTTPWSLQKKIIVTVIGIAVIILAVVLITKFVFNVDLISSTSDFAMKRKLFGSER